MARALETDPAWIARPEVPELDAAVLAGSVAAAAVVDADVVDGVGLAVVGTTAGVVLDTTTGATLSEVTVVAAGVVVDDVAATGTVSCFVVVSRIVASG